MRGEKTIKRVPVGNSWYGREMKPWIRIDETDTPDGKKLSLFQRDGDFTLRVNGVDLMSTREKSSEESLGQLGCEDLGAVKNPRILIGGLGMGFTLRAALACLSKDASILVAELFPAVIRWNQDPTFPFGASSLRDPRVSCIAGDVLEVLQADSLGFDRILLDVDNGPSALTVETNHRLYLEPALRTIKKTLREGGRVAFWTVSRVPHFEKLLRDCGFCTEIRQVRAHQTSGGSRSIYFASDLG